MVIFLHSINHMISYLFNETLGIWLNILETKSLNSSAQKLFSLFSFSGPHHSKFGY